MCISELSLKCPSLNGLKEEELAYNGVMLLVHQKIMTPENPYARYFIIDIDEQANEIDVFDSFSKFCEFQSYLVSNLFRSYASDIKYNIYLVIISNSEEKITERSRILSDYNYCRKYIFNEIEAERYFSMNEVLEKGNVKTINSLMQLIKAHETYKFDQHMEVLYLSRMLSNIKGKNEKNFFHGLIFDKKENKDSLSSLEKYYFFTLLKNLLDKKANDSANLNKYNKALAVSQEKNDISGVHIKELHLMKYRNFGDEKRVHFGRVNLLYGENGSGKTSLIEAIEKSFTGTLSNEISFGKHKNEEYEKLQILAVKDGEKEISISPENSCLYAKEWYNCDNENQANREFLRYNYFDIKGAFRFALSEKLDNNYDFYSFFVDEKILHIPKYFSEIRQQYEILIMEIEQNMQAINKEIEKIPKNKKDSNSRKKQIPQSDAGAIAMLYLVLNKSDIIDKETLPDILNVVYKDLVRRKKEYQNQLASLETITSAKMNEQKLKGLFDKIIEIYFLLTTNRDYTNINLADDRFSACKNNSDTSVDFTYLSTGQKVCFALAAMFALFLTNDKVPNFVILDEPVSHLDSFHLLNLLDVLRQLALRGTQVFFTTSNPNTAKLFRRKFSFFENEFKHFSLYDMGNETSIYCKTYKSTQEKPCSDIKC